MASSDESAQLGMELFLAVALDRGRDVPGALAYIEAGADLNHMNSESMTTLMCAAAEECNTIIDAMLKSGRDVALEARDDHGWTALITAAHRGNAETVKLLLDAGADPTAKDDMKRDALYYAQSYPEKKKLLTDAISAAAQARQTEQLAKDATVASRPVALMRKLRMKSNP
jgi:ankyrin repeat protein